MMHRALAVALLVAGCSGSAASVAAVAGSSDAPPAASVPDAPPSTTEGTTDHDARAATSSRAEICGPE